MNRLYWWIGFLLAALLVLWMDGYLS